RGSGAVTNDYEVQAIEASGLVAPFVDVEGEREMAIAVFRHRASVVGRRAEANIVAATGLEVLAADAPGHRFLLLLLARESEIPRRPRWNRALECYASPFQLILNVVLNLSA